MERRLSYSPVLVKTVELEGIVVDIRVPARNHQLIIPKKSVPRQYARRTKVNKTKKRNISA
jgi:hypothetical protein